MILADTRLALTRPLSARATVRRWVAVTRQRRALAELDDAALLDIGVSREAAEKEAHRPFWDAPDNWRN